MSQKNVTPGFYGIESRHPDGHDLLGQGLRPDDGYKGRLQEQDPVAQVRQVRDDSRLY